MDNYSEHILAVHERYCIPGLNEVKFISTHQTLCLVLGSCISTVFIGRSDQYILAANHIVIAEPMKESIVATKSARQQVDEILDIFKNAYGIGPGSIRCLHIVGAGKANKKESFTVPDDNIEKATAMVREKNYTALFADTGYNFFATYSISEDKLSVFIENRDQLNHKSFIVNLELLFSFDPPNDPYFPGSSLEPDNRGFEFLVRNNICTFITGKKNNTSDL